MWHHHTEFLMLGYGAYVVFFQFCKQAFPEISDQAVARMVAGIDVIMYRPDDELRQLARLAVEAGVADLFTEGCSPAAVLAALAERGEGGQRWLGRVRAGPRPLVQRVHRRRLLPPPPQLGRRPDGPVRRAAPVRGPGPRRHARRPAHRGAAGRTGPHRVVVPRPAGHRRGAGRVRPDARAVPAGLPVRGGPQVLLRALVHQPVLRQDPRVRRAAGPVRGAGRGRGRVPAAPHRGRPGAVRRDAGLGRGRPAAGRGPLPAHRGRAQADARGAARLVAAARPGPGARGAQRPGRAHALGRHPADDRGLAAA